MELYEIKVRHVVAALNKAYAGSGSSLCCFEDAIERPKENFKWY